MTARERAEAHVARFDRAVRDGDWERFVDAFTGDARLEFAGVPVGPFHGRDAILAAYRASPPDDTMTVLSADRVGVDTDRVRFAWGRGGTGDMEIAWRDGLVRSLVVRFDAEEASPR